MADVFIVPIARLQKLEQDERKIELIRDWARRRAVHGGHAHLSELREILGEDNGNS